MNVIETGNVYENKPEDLNPEDVQDIPGLTHRGLLHPIEPIDTEKCYEFIKTITRI